jgi:hypothetical protein
VAVSDVAAVAGTQTKVSAALCSLRISAILLLLCTAVVMDLQAPPPLAVSNSGSLYNCVLSQVAEPSS